MKTIFRLDASIRTEGSVTRAVADSFQTALTAQLGDVSITHRDVGVAPLPATAWGGALSGPHTPEDQRTTEQREGMALATALADEFLAADAYIFALPFYNFGVPQHFKALIDTLIAEPRFAPGQPQSLAGRPAQLIIARGGAYGPGTPREGWDHGTPWVKQVLADVLGLDLDVIEVELTLADVNPAMADLREMAAENLARGHAQAAENAARVARHLQGESISTQDPAVSTHAA